ncbi:glycoside hydrolase family 108 protein [Mesorhizobium sp. B1-1-8]|uniref:glycoside hydrolase family 108 protein n=1 Tax=Mesorhizobium sp. B1-1-8 TaxID=2589976 RepID=UPI001126CE9C|nr:glycosyl hydrolase 108 family protein [Mesorhizobium sp. B1-1-8]UCI06245.1 glycoside hydrolase family 108 protein [Mesorhizobium sp. B1-1-8]
MDRNFARALALVLKSEGGWSDNPADPGGATMRGVTLANFRRYVKADAGKAELRKISDAEIATVYRRFYWDAVVGAELPAGIDYAVFDFAVNSGPGRAAKYLQAVLGVAEDGRIGPATLAAAGAKPAGIVIDALCDARLAFLQRLPTWPTFGKGWSARVLSVRREALLLSARPEASVQPAPQAPVPAAEPPTASPPDGGGPPAGSARPASPGKATGIVAAVVLAVGSIAAWAAHLTCHLLGVFCQ